MNSLFKKLQKALKIKKDEEDVIDTLNGFMQQRISSSKAWQTLKDKKPHLYENFSELLTGSCD